MQTNKRLWITLAAVPALAGFLVAPQAALAKKHHVKCEMTDKDGKKETKSVATSEDCTSMGGKVVTAKATKH
jgi:hypothetical protein